MKPSQSILTYWRPWIQHFYGSSLFSRSPVSIASRQLSHLAADSRNQLRNHVAQSQLGSRRWNSSTTSPTLERERSILGKLDTDPSRPVKERFSTTSKAETGEREEQPAYEITFTCKPCQTRSTHKISKQGYHKGTILITCPKCKNRHLICDHLKIFRDDSTTIEDILKEKGELIKRGNLCAEGDIEMWDDGTMTDRTPIKPNGDTGSAPMLGSRTESAVP